MASPDLRVFYGFEWILEQIDRDSRNQVNCLLSEARQFWRANDVIAPNSRFARHLRAIYAPFTRHLRAKF
jgi:hypothetical protein